MRNSNIQKLIAFAIPIIVLLGMTFSPFLTTMLGEEIKLQTKPIDPRDLFRGDFIRLSYEAEEVHESLLEQEIKDYFMDDTGRKHPSKPLKVYSILTEGSDGIYQVEKVVIDKPQKGMYLEGEIDYLYLKTDEDIREYTATEEEFLEAKAKQTADIDYNLDKYFVPENTGIELENASNEGHAVATIKIRDGKSILTKVEITD